jgi:pilus assembly protein CpaB
MGARRWYRARTPCLFAFEVSLKNPKALLIALALAILATSAQCRYVKQREITLLELTEPRQVVVARQNIREGDRLDETMFEIQDIPAKYVQPKAIGEIDAVLGQIAGAPISEGEQLMANKLLRANEAGLAWKVSKRSRAVAISVNEVTAVGGHIRPRNFVDVLGTFDFGEGDKVEMRTITLFQNVWVLAVGSDLGHPALVGGEEDGARKSAYKNNSYTISLALSPSDAQKLVLAQSIGDLTLSLRGRFEQEKEVQLDAASVNNTLGIKKQVRYRRNKGFGVYGPGGF